MSKSTMAKSQEGSNFSALYADLNKFGQNQDFGKALKICNRILNEGGDEDETAFQCKIVCLIQLERFDDALTSINKNPKLSQNLHFEKGYCEYRLNRTKDALATLRKVSQPDVRVQELLAQVLYRLEEYQECFQVYKRLIKDTQDDYDDERETNLAAVMASLQLSSDQDVEDFGLREETYEMCFNKGCLLLSKERYREAEAMLKKAEVLCRESLEDDPDTTEEDVEEELGYIRVQLGYIYQNLAQPETAMKLYNSVVKTKPSDVGLTAVASNNIITINKEQSVFDSIKKMKAATADNVAKKLTSKQREIIAMNQGLLYLHTNQAELCRKYARQLQSQYPEDEMPSLILAAQYCNEKNVNKAIDVLKEFTASASVSFKLTLAQLYLSQGRVYPACDVLKALGDVSYSPGVVSKLVSLYKDHEDNENAANVLNDAIGWYKKKQPKSEKLPTIMRATANFHLKHGMPEVAATVLEDLRKFNPKDPSTLAQLIRAYSRFNPEKANVISKELPTPKEMMETVDVDALENNFMRRNYTKKVVKAGPDGVPSPKSGGDTGGELIVKKKKRKKKKKLPKNYDSNVDPDPERWLPRKERSYYRGKRKDKRKEIGKGTQGAGIVASELDASKPSPSASASNTAQVTGSPRPDSTPEAGPRQQKPQAAQKKKKKKKGGW